MLLLRVGISLPVSIIRLLIRVLAVSVIRLLICVLTVSVIRLLLYVLTISVIRLLIRVLTVSVIRLLICILIISVIRLLRRVLPVLIHFRIFTVCSGRLVPVPSTLIVLLSIHCLFPPVLSMPAASFCVR